MLFSYYQNRVKEAGLDEAGRGCFAGPVFAAAVVLPFDFHHPLLNDSKQLTEKERDNDEIDCINILQASFKAMHCSVDKLLMIPGLLLIDGNRFKPYTAIPHECIIKGDGKYASIAAASVLAKTYRDEYMRKLHAEFPHYCWHTNKGYGTPEHRQAIEEHGLCRYHRKSFNIFRDEFQEEV